MRKISAEERDKLLDAIPLISAYVAFADGSLDKQEIHSAKRITNLRRYNPDKEPAIRDYYKDVFKSFDDRFSQLVGTLPIDEEERMRILEEKLSEINLIIKKVDPLHRNQLKKSFMSFAHHVAKAEGGILGMGGIGPGQAKAVKLEMFSDLESI